MATLAIQASGNGRAIRLNKGVRVPAGRRAGLRCNGGGSVGGGARLGTEGSPALPRMGISARGPGGSGSAAGFALTGSASASAAGGGGGGVRAVSIGSMASLGTQSCWQAAQRSTLPPATSESGTR